MLAPDPAARPCQTAAVLQLPRALRAPSGAARGLLASSLLCVMQMLLLLSAATACSSNAAGDRQVNALLGCYACRCGADKATAVEAVRHMADTATHVLALNGLANITVVHKDARYLDSADVPAAADLLVFEVSGVQTCQHSQTVEAPT